MSGPDPSSICEWFAKGKDIADRISKLIRSIDHYPFMMVHVRLNDMGLTPTETLRLTMKIWKGRGAKMVFSLIFPIKGSRI